MANVYFDTETKSDSDLIKYGSKNHINSSESDIVCMAYRIGIDSKTMAWFSGNGSSPPDVFKYPDNHIFYAHNIQFDREVVNSIGPRYGFKPLQLEQCIDVQALVARFGFPQSLANAGKALNVSVTKSASGTRLINKISKPPWVYTAEDMKEFIVYCIKDVDSMCEIIRALPSDKLTPEEQIIWINTATINETGIPLDIRSAQRIYAIMEQYKEERMKLVPEITDGEINSTNQQIAIVNWINRNGGHIQNLTKGHVQQILEYNPPWLNDRMKLLLELRRELSLTSTGKYLKLINYNYKGRMHYNLRYFGGHTGRESGQNFQIQNLPRMKADDVEKEINKFFNMSILDDGNSPVQSAKSLIRSMILAVPGTMLAVFDYASIEYRVLNWIVGDDKELKALKQGRDRYAEFASILYKKKVGKKSRERNVGKTTVLGAGYCLSAKGLYKQCEGYGIDITEEETEWAIKLFRDMHPKIVQFWNDLDRCSKQAVLHINNEFTTNGCTYKSLKDRNGRLWLTLLLPSQRYVYYCEPEIGNGMFGPVITHMGTHPKTKKWSRLELGKTKLVENVIQALARDILMDGRIRISNVLNYKVLASVHDENIVEVPFDCHKDHWEKIKNTMEIPPSWCENLPLAVSGYCERRYRKD